MDVLDVLNSNLTGTVRLTGSIASAVCLAVISLILLLLVFYKAYTTTLQRLLLYLTIITVIQEVCLTVNCATQFEYSEHETFCDVISSFWQWSDTVGYLLTLAMIVYLPYKIYQQFKGDPFPRLSRSNCCRVALECLFIFIVLVLPLTYILPLAHCGYFLMQPQLCNRLLIDQVMYLATEHCTSQLFSSGVPYYVGFVDFVGIFVVIILLSVVFCCLVREYRETRITLRRTLILLGFFVVYFIIELALTIGVMNNVTKLGTSLKFLEVVLVVGAAIIPVFQLIFPLTFLFYLYSFNLCRWRTIKRAAAGWRHFQSCCGRENAPGADRMQEAATAPGSHHVTAPNVTFFDVPHSTLTTDVPTEEQALLPNGGGDRGHSTIMNS